MVYPQPNVVRHKYGDGFEPNVRTIETLTVGQRERLFMKSPEHTIKLDPDFLDRNSGENSLALISSFDTQPALKLLTKHGVFLWGSDQLNKWVHPEDLELASQLIPGYRVFRREPCRVQKERDEGYVEIFYGSQSLRIRPIVWLEVHSEGFTIGDRVEVLSDQGKRRPGLATVQEMRWNRHLKQIEYNLARNELTFRRVYTSKELRHATKLNSFLTKKQLQRNSLR